MTRRRSLLPAPAGTAASEGVKPSSITVWAAVCGWRYTVMAGWLPHMVEVLDALSARHRPLEDQLELRGQLLRAVGERPAGTYCAA
ncbi:hypothetical protein AB0M61_19875 [Streptomyces sp. NPDC051642]|uniref:hypothetical protein n=1 Tax=Streptomyces sp. NPDC051642 TaxID=3154646 RepID=UPI003434C24C